MKEREKRGKQAYIERREACKSADRETEVIESVERGERK